jgi:hypothetical protein
MSREWDRLKKQVGEIVADIHNTLQTQTVGVFLLDQLEWLASVVRSEPKNEIERNAMILTIRDARDDFARFAESEAESGRAESADCLGWASLSLATLLWGVDR